MDLLPTFQKILESFIIPFQWNCDLKEYFLKSCGRTHVVCRQEIFACHRAWKGFKKIKKTKGPSYYYALSILPYTQIAQFYPRIHELLNTCLLFYSAQMTFMKTVCVCVWGGGGGRFLVSQLTKQSVQNVTPTTKFISTKKLAASAFFDKSRYSAISDSCFV